MSMPCRMQPLPAFGRQRGTSDRHTMNGIAVVIRAAGDQETEFVSHAVIAIGSGRIVIRVIGLERIETGVAQLGNSRVDLRASWMRQRRQSTGAMNHLDHGLR